MFKTTTLVTAVAGLALAGAANAAVVPVQAISGHNGGNYQSYYGHLSDMVNGLDPSIINTGAGADNTKPGMDTTPDPSDPATWLNTTPNSWQNEWLANGRLDSTTSANNKIGWVIVDFGSVISDLENIYMWACQMNSPGEDARDFNLYYSSGGGIDAIPAMVASKQWANGSQANADYDFSSGDWTQIGSTNTLASPTGDGVTAIHSLGGVSAQYIAIEILTAENTDPNDRVGIAQIEFTSNVVPEPGSLALLGLGGLLIARRRRG